MKKTKNIKVFRRNGYFLALVVVIMLLVVSLQIRYSEKRVDANKRLNANSVQMLSLCQEYMATSKNLTFLARNFVESDDLTYFEEYWKIRNSEQDIEKIYAKLTEGVTEEEEEYLIQVKNAMHEVEEREIYAMKKVLIKNHINYTDYKRNSDMRLYVQFVREYDTTRLEEEMKSLPPSLILINHEYEKNVSAQNKYTGMLISSIQVNLEKISLENKKMSRASVLLQFFSLFVLFISVFLMIMQNNKVDSLKNVNDIILSVAKDEYSMIGQVDLNSQQIIHISQDDEENDLPDYENDYMKVMNQYAEKHVNAAFQENFLRTVQPVNIIGKFEQGNKIVSCVFINATGEWQIIDFSKSKSYSEEKRLVSFTIKNAVEIVEQQKEQRQRDEMLMHFSREYFEVYVVDLNKGSYEIIRSSERFGNYIKNMQGDFSQLMELAIVSWTKPPYRDCFRQLLDMEEIKRKFYAGTNKIEFIYESYDENWKSLQCFPVPEYGPDNEKMIFALRDFNEEMQVRTNEVLATEAMNNIYMMVAFRDIEADKYECIHCTEDLFELQEKGDYEDLVNQTLALMHQDDKEKYLDDISDEKLKYEGRAESEFRLIDKQGKYHYYHEYITKVEVPSGSRLAILVKNVDEAKMHEIWVAEQLQKELMVKAKELEMTKLLAKKSKDLEKALKQAESANVAKSQFLSNMSHDLRTPMNAILGMTYLAKKHIDDREQLSKCLETILTSSEGMVALINDILDMNKIESGIVEVKRKPANIAKLLVEIENLFQNKCLNNRQEFTVTYDEVVHFDYNYDELRVKQVLTNLVSNAVKYTQSFGHISLTVRERAGMDEKHRVLEFIVLDDGIGMNESFIKRIFEPFEREETVLLDKVEGTGLGMAIVKKYIDVMDGTIEIDSAPNVGSKITVCLPLEMCEKADVENSSVIDFSSHKYPGKHILIVEDKRINMEIVKGFLEDTELIIDEARNGKEAVEKFSNSAEGTYDLIFMDIRMPVMKGDEATSYIRKMERSDSQLIPIIAMTANALDNDVENSYRCGMNGHISKPIEPEEVYKCLNKWLLGA